MIVAAHLSFAGGEDVVPVFRYLLQLGEMAAGDFIIALVEPDAGCPEQGVLQEHAMRPVNDVFIALKGLGRFIGPVEAF